jgi:hypothetical protein
MKDLDKEIINGTHHEYVKNQMMQKDKNWFILFLVICTIFIGAIVHEMDKVKKSESIHKVIEPKKF